MILVWAKIKSGMVIGLDRVILVTFFLVFSTLIYPGISPANAALGDTTVAKWKDNKAGSFTLNFDDSNSTQADIVIPQLINRGLVGTFYINPGHRCYSEEGCDPGCGVSEYGSTCNCYSDVEGECPWVCKKPRYTVFENEALNSGQELANHTWDHSGWDNCAEAEYQIRMAAEYIWNLTGKPNSMLSKCSPGGVTKNCDNVNAIFEKYYSIGRGGNIAGGTAQEMINHAQGAINQGIWRGVVYHQVDGVSGWGPVECSEFIAFLDWLVTKKDQLWVATFIDQYKYKSERNAAAVTILENNQNQIRLRLSLSGSPPKYTWSLYDLPLTLITEVPLGWVSCEVSQNGQARTYPVDINRKVQYEAFPERGEVILRKACATPPPGDVNGDCTVNVSDLIQVISAWGQDTLPEDLIRDHQVNSLDAAMVITNWSS